MSESNSTRRSRNAPTTAAVESLRFGSDGDAVASRIGTLGEEIRSLRRQRGLTLKDVASETGVSVSLLSMVERSAANPSIGTVVAIADALNVPVARLFQNSNASNSADDPVIPADAQGQLTSETGMRQRIIVHNAARGFEWTQNRYEPHGCSSHELLRHNGYEVGFVVSGSLEVIIEDESYLLRAGDAIEFDSSHPHRFYNPGPHDSVSYWANLLRPGASEDVIVSKRTRS